MGDRLRYLRVCPISHGLTHNTGGLPGCGKTKYMYAHTSPTPIPVPTMYTSLVGGYGGFR